MPVKGEEELQRVLVEHLHRRIQERDSKVLPIRAVPYAKHIVGHLKCLLQSHGDCRFALFRFHSMLVPISDSNFFDPNLFSSCSDVIIKVPELDFLVGASGDHAQLVRSDVEGPDCALMCFDGLKYRGGREIVDNQIARLRPDHDL